MRRWKVRTYLVVGMVIAAATGCVVACTEFAASGGASSDADAGDAAGDASTDAPSPADALSPTDAGDADAPTLSPRVECRSSPPRSLGAPEPLGSPPPPAPSGNAYFWGIAALDDDIVYVSTGDDFGGGNGRIYRVRVSVTPAEWSLFAETPAPGSLVIRDGYLFARHFTVTRFRLDCPTAPCTSGESVVSGGPNIDALWVQSASSAYAVPYYGELIHATRGSDPPWQNVNVGPMDLETSYRTAAATDDALFVAQRATDFIHVFPFDAAAPPGARLDVEGGAIVVADCRHLFSLGSPILAIDPDTRLSRSIGDAGVPVAAQAIDEGFVYVGYDNGGLMRFRKDGTQPAGEQIAAGMSVWGMAVTQDVVYYGNHGAPGTLYRRRKQ